MNAALKQYHLLGFAIVQLEFHHHTSLVPSEFTDVQASLRKGRGTRDKIANIRWIMEKARGFQKSIYFCFIDYTKAFDCVDHNKLWKILKKWEYQTT